MITGGTLMVSRLVKNHGFYKKRLEDLGFPDVTITALKRDGLHSQIRDLKPKLLIMSARYYHCCTPYMMGELKKKFPDTNMAAVCIGEYPADLAMYFILNGVKSFVMSSEGIDEWYKGLEEIRRGRKYVSEIVLDRIAMRDPEPEAARVLSKLLIEVVRCICNGFKKWEIADTLEISERTVEKHRNEIYRFLNVGNGEDLIRTALGIGLVTQEELVFKHPNFVCTPLPNRKIKINR
jgi:DNA-binding NarL/FixJ family response regulator